MRRRNSVTRWQCVGDRISHTKLETRPSRPRQLWRPRFPRDAYQRSASRLRTPMHSWIASRVRIAAEVSNPFGGGVGICLPGWIGDALFVGRHNRFQQGCIRVDIWPGRKWRISSQERYEVRGTSISPSSIWSFTVSLFVLNWRIRWRTACHQNRQWHGNHRN
jgi:hypothetical protein